MKVYAWYLWPRSRKNLYHVTHAVTFCWYSSEQPPYFIALYNYKGELTTYFNPDPNGTTGDD